LSSKKTYVDDSRFSKYVDKYELVNGRRSESITSHRFCDVFSV